MIFPSPLNASGEHGSNTCKNCSIVGPNGYTTDGTRARYSRTVAGVPGIVNTLFDMSTYARVAGLIKLYLSTTPTGTISCRFSGEI